MPKVPEYTPNQVQARPLADTRQSAALPAGAFGAGIGEALGQVGDIAAAAALDMQGREDETLVKESITNFRSELNTAQQLGDDAYYNLQGKDAYEAVKPQTEKLSDIRKAYADGLATDRQKQLFGDVADRILNNELDSMSTHGAAQFKSWQNNEDDAAAALALQSAALRYTNPDQLRIERETIITSIVNKAERNGWGPEQRAFEVGVRVSAMHKSVLSAMMREDPAGAREYLTANEGELTAGDAGAVEKALTVEETKVKAFAAFDEIRAKGGSYTAQVGEARVIEDPDVRKAAVQLVDEDFARQARITAAQDKATLAAIHLEVENTGSTAGLTSDQQDFLAGKGLTANINERARQLSGDVQPSHNSEVWTTFSLMGADKLADMTAEEYQARYRSKFDNAHYDQGLGLIRQASSADAREQRKAANTTARYSTANAAAIRVTSGLSSSKKKDLKGPVSEAMLLWTDRFFEENKRNPTATEANKYAAELMLEGEYSSWSFLGYTREPNAPYITAAGKGKGASFILDTEAENIPQISTATGVPEAILPGILEWMDDRNIPVTVDNISSAYSAGTKR